MSPRVLYYFRKDLRLHDHPPLLAALDLNPESLIPVFILDPHYVSVARCGVNRWRFLLESLHALHANLKAKGSRLLVLRGNPLELLPILFNSWNISHIVHETDTEPFWQHRDAQIAQMAEKHQVNVLSVHGHTLYDPLLVVKTNKGLPPLTIKSFQQIIQHLPLPPDPIMDLPTSLPPLGHLASLKMEQIHSDQETSLKSSPKAVKTEKKENAQYQKVHHLPEAFKAPSGPNHNYDVPTLDELGFSPAMHPHPPFYGGEQEALKLLEEFFQDKKRVALFEKPKTNPAAFNPASTTVLSPHLKWGTLSCRLFYAKLMEIYKSIKKHSEPPVSLLGQLYWREFYYAVAAVTPDYHRMQGNPVCLQIDWWCQDNTKDPRHPEAEHHLKAWTHGQTGYPWIDAIMRQLRTEGWIHHLARHSVACFLTRGDLFISWERGAEVFEELLLDHDSALNIGNWLWLSSSAFFTSYFRVYSPVVFAKQHDKTGEYIRRYVPELKEMPTQYIHEPWTAPLAVQQKAKCIIDTDYPHRIVIHEEVMKVNLSKMKEAYAKGMKGSIAERAFIGPLAESFLPKWQQKAAQSNVSSKKRKVEDLE